MAHGVIYGNRDFFPDHLVTEARGDLQKLIDREINSTDVATAQLLSDNYAGCVALGQYFVENLDESGNYVELLGLVGDNNTWNRSEGFHSVVDRYDGLKVTAQQSADFDRNKAMEVMESILQSEDEIDADFCGNDAMAMGAYQALLGAGKQDEVLVFGYDGGLCYAFPSFRIRANHEQPSTPPSAGQLKIVSVADHVDQFFAVQLPKATGQAISVATLLEAAAKDPAAARSQFGRQVGIGGTTVFFLRSSGRVVDVEKDRCRIEVDPQAAVVLLRTGLLVGSSARDATGLIDVNQFASSRDYNQLAAALNRKIESDVVQPVLDQLRRGAQVRFVGCAEVRGDSDFDPLTATPVLLEVQPPDSVP